MADSVSAASFSAADISFIQGFQDTLIRDIASGHEYGGLLTKISRHLASFKDSRIEKCTCWGPVTCVTMPSSSAEDQNFVQIIGPLPDDYFEIPTASQKIASTVVRYVSALSTACQRVEEIRERLISVKQKQKELEQAQLGLSQPADITVDDHIRLLRQYNKTKDVGQQLIGLIAESRGVSLGIVYQDGEYGVLADD